jgi:hypothetical protein
MTGPDHYRKAEELTAKAHDYLGQGEGRVPLSGPPSPRFTPLSPSPLLPRSRTTAADGRAWTEVAGTKFSAGAP